MANVLNEFLYSVSKGFQDAAFATYSRRRSTVRDDITQSFGEEEIGEDLFETAYKTGEESSPAGIDIPEIKGSVNLSPQAKKGKKRSSGLKEL